jgi:deoxyribodipyrimidine photo-lyase
VAERWPVPTPALLRGEALAPLAIDHSVPAAAMTGGSAAAEQALRSFLELRLDRYAEDRNRPDRDGGSLLSPYLHTGHLASHQVFLELMTRQRWSIEDLFPRCDGRRSGWWGISESAEAFLDQLITWRELGFNLCRLRDDYESYSAVPAWARRTLDEHATDTRPYQYRKEQLEAAETHDALWNAAQRQLLLEGRIHGYLRMLWGKKVLEWSEHPAQALATLFELNDRHALDGNDPNSATGMLWILGRYDRPWGPRRPIFGTVRYMSSANTARKLPVKEYLQRYGDNAEDQGIGR